MTSPDYRRLDEVAARIQQLAESHRVIVLTHNIMFASALISVRQNKKLRAKIYEVRDGGATKGIPAPDVEPRLDTAADPAKRINVKLESIPGAEPVLQDALIKETYDLLRARCEAFVEQELLQNVTQRYRANIMMTRLSKIDTGRFDAAVAVIEPLFARACDRMTGHSHAAEYMSTKPTVDELQGDWEQAKAAGAAYTGLAEGGHRQRGALAIRPGIRCACATALSPKVFPAVTSVPHLEPAPATSQGRASRATARVPQDPSEDLPWERRA
ncbi:hypothetical protein [Nocardioides sp. B-3]|uniref:hypothetical protein n=1 Tax=Nocardioides sp. B-3 TaxID=2895565 RepID=UPI0021526484|nr:hypothetical protein [Nocardioides sp. B-3]UUZ58572.1 hypothetical protein LP418_20800 [Nocardioides sp. B-3]